MNKKIIGIIAVVVVVVAVLATSAHNSGKDGVVKIGSIIPLTDFGAFWGESTKAGMDLAVQDLKKEGFAVEVIYEDSAGKPDLSATAAQKLINIDNVDYLFTDFSGPSNAVAPIAKENEVILAYSSFDPGIVSENEYTIKTFMDAVEQCEVFAKYAKDSGITKVGYIGVNLSFTEPCMDKVREFYSNENVIVETVASPAETDFRSSLAKLKEENVEFLISYGYEGNYEAIMKQSVETNTSIPIFCVESDCYTEKVAKTVPSNELNESILFDYHPPQEFVDRIEDEFGEGINPKAAAFGYDVVQYLVRVSEKCDSSDTKCVAKNLDNISYQSVVPGNGFGDDRVFDVQPNYYKVVDGKKVKINI